MQVTVSFNMEALSEQHWDVDKEILIYLIVCTGVDACASVNNQLMQSSTHPKTGPISTLVDLIKIILQAFFSIIRLTQKGLHQIMS